MNVYYNDIDPFCCAVLKKNIERGYLPEGTIDGRDIRTIHPDELMGYQHIHLFAGIGGFAYGMARAGYPLSLRTITGGFPCQDISVAGKGAGIEGERSGLWKEMLRLVRALRPDYVLVENVAALLIRGMGTVLGDLASWGYDAEWQVLSAEAFGAPHKRERLFLVAYPDGTGCTPSWAWQQTTPFVQCSQTLAEGVGQRLQRGRQQTGIRTPPRRRSSAIFERRGGPWPKRSEWWQSEPSVGRVVARLPARMDRLRALGNAIVPQVAEYVARSIMAYEKQHEEAT